MSREQAFSGIGFKKTMTSYSTLKKDQERTFDRLSAELHKVEPHLTFEFGPKDKGRREFTISADGIRDAFPAVERLYAAAPALSRWKIQKFRQRREPSDISFQGVKVRASSVTVDLDKEGEKVNVGVFIPGYTESARETYLSVTFLLLDQALGEYDVETRVGTIAVKDVTQASTKAFPLKDLPKHFDELNHRK